jgi:hypothetical protein
MGCEMLAPTAALLPASFRRGVSDADARFFANKDYSCQIEPSTSAFAGIETAELGQGWDNILASMCVP